MDSPTLREAVSDAIHYWEPRRLLYNALLAGIVLFYFFYALRTNPSLKASLSVNGLLGLFLLAVWRMWLIVRLTSLRSLPSGRRIATCGDATAG